MYTHYDTSIKMLRKDGDNMPVHLLLFYRIKLVFKFDRLIYKYKLCAKIIYKYININYTPKLHYTYRLRSVL